MTSNGYDSTVESIETTGSDISEEATYTKLDKNSPVKRYLDSQPKRKLQSQDSQPLGEILNLPFKNTDSQSKNNSQLKATDFINKNYKRRRIDEDVSVEKDTNNVNIGIRHQKDTWVKQSAPKNITELFIHKRKIEDLKTEITNLIFNKAENRILVVSGPSGSGKSTSVKLLAHSIMKSKINLMKRRMIGSEISDSISSDINDNFIIEFNILKSSHRGISSTSYFSEFLNQCKMLTGLNERCIVIEELPNLFHRDTLIDFQTSILNWIESDSNFHLPPMIICITEFDIENDLDWNNGTSFTIENTVKVETVLGYKVMQYENIGWKRIKFNRVAKTFLKKALNRVLSLEEIQTNKIIERKVDVLSSLGDIRNAINALEFWYKFQYNAENLLNDNTGSKETALDIFHSIGKIIYGTKHEKEEFEDFKKRHNNANITSDQLDPEIITIDNVSNEIMSHLIRFNLCCLENYSLINPFICDKLTEMLNVLSVSDNIVQRNREFGNSHILKNLAFYDCFGLRIYCKLLKTVKNRSDGSERGKVIFSRDSKLKKKLQTVYHEIDDFQASRRKKMINMKNYSHLNQVESALIDGFYQSNIMSSFKFRYQRYLRGYHDNINSKVDRIGGNFTNSITADDEFKADSGEEDNGKVVSNISLRDKLKMLEEEYFGGMGLNEDDASVDGGELESDPLEEESEVEAEAEDNGDNLRGDAEDEDAFSDDSAVLKHFF